MKTQIRYAFVCMMLACMAIGYGVQAQKPQLVEDIVPGPQAWARSSPMGLTPYGEWLLFAASDTTYGQELWRWKQMGTPAERLTDNNLRNQSGCDYLGTVNWSKPMTEFNGSIYFASYIKSNELRLLKYNGVVPPDTVGDSAMARASYYSTVMQNRLYYLGITYNGNFGWNLRIWSYDGVHPPIWEMDLGDIGNHYYGGNGLTNFVAYRGKIYFMRDSLNTDGELWSFDPSSHSVSQVADIWPGMRGSHIQNLIVGGSKLYFTANDSLHGGELYAYDGNSVTRLTDLLPGTGSGVSNQGHTTGVGLCYHQGGIFFDGRETPNQDALYRYDTASGMVTKVFDLSPNGGGYTNFYSTPNNLFFNARTQSGGTELYKYNGEKGSLVADLNPGAGNGVSGSNMALFGGYVYFAGDNGNTGWELYRVKDSNTSTSVIEPLRIGGITCRLFPNPAPNGRFNISLDAKQAMQAVRVTISDITGRQIQSRQFAHPGTHFFEEINLSSAAPGIYFVRIEADGTVITRRVSVE